jgi:hypothetical protein
VGVRDVGHADRAGFSQLEHWDFIYLFVIYLAILSQ